MALTKDTPRAYELGTINALPVKASSKIYEGSAVGIDTASGYARALNAGDPFVGFAESNADNSSGSNGDIRVRVRTVGEVELAIGSLAVTDIEKPVYASDDGTFTLTATSNSYIGKVARFGSSGVGVVAFDTQKGGLIASLTAATGTPGDTIADVGAAFNQTTLNNNFASLSAKVNFLLSTVK